MDLTTLLESMQSALGDNIPSILGALAIILLGWIVARIVRTAVGRMLGFLRLNERIRKFTDIQMNLERGIAQGAFALILLLALIGSFNALNLGLISSPLQSLVEQVFAYAPRLAAGALLGLLAWIFATLVRRGTTRVLSASGLDEKVRPASGTRPMSESLGHLLFWLVILLFLPAIFGAMALEGLLLPTRALVDKILTFVPNLLAAAVIAFVGWFAGRLLRDIVSNLVAASGADDWVRRAGFREGMRLSKIAGTVVYVLVLLPAIVAALDALRMEAISAPATAMLATFLGAIPNLIAAAVVLAVAWFVSRIIAGFVTTLLTGAGFNELPRKLGMERGMRGETTPSMVVGKLVVVFMMLFATVEAAQRLGFAQVSTLAAAFTRFGGQVLLGAVIIAVGIWLSKLAHGAIMRIQGRNSGIFAGLSRWTILGLITAIGLRSMGIADDIVNLAFGLTLGSVAVAVALSFGLGGREAAGRQMEHWLSDLRGD